MRNGEWLLLARVQKRQGEATCPVAYSPVSYRVLRGEMDLVVNAYKLDSICSAVSHVTVEAARMD